MAARTGRPNTLDRAATGTGSEYIGLRIKYMFSQIPGYTAELRVFKQLLPQT